jgi:hypothetical protein
MLSSIISVGGYEYLMDQGLERYPGLQPSGCQVVTSSSTPVLIVVCSKLLLEEVFSVFNQHLLQTTRRDETAHGDAKEERYRALTSQQES